MRNLDEISNELKEIQVNFNPEKSTYKIIDSVINDSMSVDLMIKSLQGIKGINKYPDDIKNKYFLGDINFNYKEYKDEYLKANYDDIIDDLLNQIYQNSIISNKKYISFTNGVRYFLLGFVSLLIIYGLGLLIYL